MLSPRINFAAAVVGGRIYVIGGYGGQRHGKYSSIEEYNPVADKWQYRKSMKSTREKFAAAVSSGRIYVIGGLEESTAIALVEEYDPPFYDTDIDGVADDDELRFYGTDPFVPNIDFDSDNDGLTNVDELNKYFTDPWVSDANSDTDEDGLLNVDEADIYRTDPLTADSDNDGLTDTEEVTVYETNPLSSDSDEDELPDSFEVTHSLNPLTASDAKEDPDQDGLTNLSEYLYGTNPNTADTDQDGFLDGAEVIAGTNPHDPTDPPITTRKEPTTSQIVITETKVEPKTNQSHYWIDYGSHSRVIRLNIRLRL